MASSVTSFEIDGKIYYLDLPIMEKILSYCSTSVMGEFAMSMSMSS